MIVEIYISPMSYIIHINYVYNVCLTYITYTVEFLSRLTAVFFTLVFSTCVLQTPTNAIILVAENNQKNKIK